MVHQHYSLGGCDWYVAEYDPEERIFHGYAILNDDLDNAESGYVTSVAGEERGGHLSRHAWQ